MFAMFALAAPVSLAASVRAISRRPMSVFSASRRAGARSRRRSQAPAHCAASVAFEHVLPSPCCSVIIPRELLAFIQDVVTPCGEAQQKFVAALPIV